METDIRRPGGLSKFQSTNREECGVIVEEGDLIYIVKVPNISKSPRDYAILLEDVQIVEGTFTADEQVVGFFHTHLEDQECSPSDADLKGAEIFPDSNNLIYKPSTGELCWYGIAEVDTL